LIASARDVSELRRLRSSLDEKVKERTATLQRRTEALRASEARYAAILEGTHDGIVSIDGEQRIIVFNRGAERIFGYAAEEILGEPLHRLIPRRVAEIHPRLVRDFAGGPRSLRTRAGTRVVDGVRKDGSVVRTETSISVLHTEEGPLFTALVRDVTELAELEEQLRHSQKMDAIGRLAGGVAHDFNNLLSGILGFAEVAIDALDPQSPARSDLEEIIGASARGRELTRQLLIFSRREPSEATVLEIDAELQRVLGSLRRILGEDIQLETELGAAGARAHIGRGELEQIVLNLVVNAREAMPEGGRLRLRTSRDASIPGAEPERSPLGCVRLEVEDEGEGIDPAIRHRIFEPFYSTKPRGQGTGLGLSTVHGVLALRGGAITVDPAPVRGSRFRIYLPITQSPATAPEEPEAPLEPVGGQPSVLVVDDQDLLRRVLQRILRRAGYRVQTADSAAQARSLIDSGERFSAVITDIVMPGESGIGLARDLNARYPSLPLIFITGHSDELLLGEAGLAAIPEVPILRKPISQRQLQEALSRALESSSSELAR
ncbi:MAG: PAS domain S-box protein, partial [Myxococcales bacterium]|nr:PAS domain S-box protein [Myxococcales bacterium]